MVRNFDIICCTLNGTVTFDTLTEAFFKKVIGFCD